MCAYAVINNLHEVTCPRHVETSSLFPRYPAVKTVVIQVGYQLFAIRVRRWQVPYLYSKITEGPTRLSDTLFGKSVQQQERDTNKQQKVLFVLVQLSLPIPKSDSPRLRRWSSWYRKCHCYSSRYARFYACIGILCALSGDFTVFHPSAHRAWQKPTAPDPATHRQ